MLAFLQGNVFMKLRNLGIVVLIVGTVACSSTPTAPTVTPPPIITPVPAMFIGRWAGSYAMTSCASPIGVCETLGNDLKIIVALGQSGSNVSGRLGIGSMALDVAGTVAADGTLSLTGTGKLESLTVTLTTWRSTLDANHLRGSFGFVMTDASGTTVLAIEATLTDVTLL